MPGTMDWDDFEEIGIQLAEKFPDTDPLTVRFTEMHKWVTELEGFEGDPKMSNEGKLETIQMAWLEEYKERQAGYWDRRSCLPKIAGGFPVLSFQVKRAAAARVFSMSLAVR